MRTSRDFYTKPEAIAYCYDCGWECEARNAWPVGARHARTYNHHVTVEVSRTFVYNAKERTEER